MTAVKRKYGERGKVVAYHGYQSFQAGEVTPEEAHMIGVETVRRMWGDRFQVVVTTHNSAELTEKTYAGELYRRKDGRTRCIFDNGTESTMLFRSLVKAMQHDGFSISGESKGFSAYEITDEDHQCGYIYVLRTSEFEPESANPTNAKLV